MSDFLVAVAAFCAIWLGVLTITVLALVRQLAVLSVRFQLGQAQFNGAADGLEMGTTIPDSVRHLVPEAAREAAIVVLSATCAPCRQIAPRLDAHPGGIPLIALVSGPPKLADPFAASINRGARILLDPDATISARELGIQSTPFAMHVVKGRVEGKAYLHEAGDLTRLVAAHERRTSPSRSRLEDTHATPV